MIKKILDYIFSRGQPPITEETVEEYLAGKEIKPKKPKIPKLAAALLLFVVAASVFALTVFRKSEPEKTPKFIQTVQKPASKKEKPPASTASKKAQKKPEKEKAVVRKKKPEKKTVPSKTVAEAEKDLSDNLTAELRNPFDISGISTEIESLQVQSKILEKKVELMKRKAELLEVQKKVKELERELKETSLPEKDEAKQLKSEPKKEEPEKTEEALKETEEVLASLFEDLEKEAVAEPPETESADLKDLFGALEEETEEEKEEPAAEEEKKADTESSILLGRALAVAFSVQSADLDRGCITLISGREICSGRTVAVRPNLLKFSRLYFTEKGRLVLEFESENGKKFLVEKDLS